MRNRTDSIPGTLKLLLVLFLISFGLLVGSACKGLRTRLHTEQSTSCCGDSVCAEQHHHSANRPSGDSVTEKDLQTWYVASNRAYFSGRLPQNVTVSWGDLSEQHYVGHTIQRGDGSFLLLVDRRTNPTASEAYLTVFHEQCHLSLWNTDDFEQHGPKFQSCMTQLALKGAFEELW